MFESSCYRRILPLVQNLGTKLAQNRTGLGAHGLFDLALEAHNKNEVPHLTLLLPSQTFAYITPSAQTLKAARAGALSPEMEKFALGISPDLHSEEVMLLARELTCAGLYKKLSFLIEHAPEEIDGIYDKIIPTNIVPRAYALSYRRNRWQPASALSR